jgi:hypothetical protein
MDSWFRLESQELMFISDQWSQIPWFENCNIFQSYKKLDTSLAFREIISLLAYFYMYLSESIHVVMILIHV